MAHLPKGQGVVPMPPFKAFLATNIPAIYDNTMSYYDELTSLIKYLQDTIVPALNDNAEAITVLSNAIEQLQDYVDHYFDNLDVQEEINKKLDGLVADGTLEQLIGAYIQPRIDDQNTRISALYSNVDTFEGTVNGQLAAFTNLIDSVTNGSPLVATSTDDMTDTTKVYVNTTDGKWYYYDGDSWEIGGTYQSSGISSGSITLSMLGSDVKYNLHTTIDGVDKGQYLDTIELDLTNNLVNNAVTNDGEIGSESTVRVATSNLIYIPFGYAISCDDDHSNDYLVTGFWFDDSFTFTDSRRFDSGSSVFPFISCKNNRYVRIGFRKSNNGTIQPTDVTADVVISLKQRLSNKSDNIVGTNLANLSKSVNGYLDTASTANYYAKSNSYKTLFPIRMEKGTTYHVSTLRKFAQYDNDMNYIPDSFVSSATTNYSFTATQNGYFVVSCQASASLMVNSGASAETYTPYVETLPDYVQLQNTSNLSGLVASKNILTGKTYVALGDSFTHGDFTNAPEDDYHIEEGTYSGQYKVYPYLIGNRNDMTIINLAQNGMTMTKISNDWSNYVSDAVLANIPETADYITIKIGINDNPDHHNSNLGTINDDTNDTFYGRYNRVMNYLITNFPQAKIGIIISNGQTSLNFINAAIAIAQKYGVAYLNETTDNRVPLLMRTMRSDVLDSVKTARNNNWYVSTTTGSTNYHPNAKCHEYESTIVENFLRSL